MKRNKTLYDYVKEYEEKTGEEFQTPQGFTLFFLPERGFAQMRIYEGMVVVFQVCGDLLFWFDFAKVMAASNGCKCVITTCIRHILPYIRKLRCHIVKKEGDYRYICEDELGNKSIYSWRLANDGSDTYTCTYYLGEVNYGRR